MAGEFSGRTPSVRQPTVVAGALLLVLPWIWPITAGPSPNVIPLLTSWACGLLALLVLCVGPGPARWLQATVPPAWLAAAMLSAGIGMLQWFDVAPQTVLLSPAQVGEAYGNLRQKNQFATLMAIGLAVLLFRPGRLMRPASIGMVLVLASGSALSASRTGLLHWVLLTVLAMAWPGARRERAQLCAISLAAYVLAGMLAPLALAWWRGIDATNVFGRISSDLGCSSRKVLWSNVLHLIAQKPWVGWGWGELDYAHFAVLYPGERFCDILDNAHNLPLHLAVELGIPLTLLLGALLGAIVWRARPWRASGQPAQLAWGVLVLIGAHSLLEYPLWYGPFQLAALLCVALLLRPFELGPRARAGASLGAVILLVGLAAAWRTYDTVSQAYLPPEQRRSAMREDPVRAAGEPWLFADQVRFAELAITPVTAGTAARVNLLATAMLHQSPEPAVISKLIDSALLLGRQEQAQWAIARFRAAFPQQYLEWSAGRQRHDSRE